MSRDVLSYENALFSDEKNRCLNIKKKKKIVSHQSLLGPLSFTIQKSLRILYSIEEGAKV